MTDHSSANERATTSTTASAESPGRAGNDAIRTTRVLSVSIPVSDQDAAKRFYVDVLGCELTADVEIWPGARLVQVLPPGSSVPLVLLPPDSPIPVAVRLGTTDAEAAYRRLADSGVQMHNDQVLQLAGSPPMFHFSDPDGNDLVYLQDGPQDADQHQS